MKVRVALFTRLANLAVQVTRPGGPCGPSAARRPRSSLTLAAMFTRLALFPGPAAVSAVLVAGLTACSGAASGAGPTAGTSSTIPLIRVSDLNHVTSQDEAKYLGAADAGVLALETMLKFGPQGQLEPDLATSWAQTSPVTYVYHLRHDVKFWDGHPLTASDVAYSMNHYRAPGSQAAFAYTGVKSIIATDPYTVTVTLSQPEASWRNVPAEPTAMIFEKQFQQAHAATFGQPGTLVMGSGPWEFDSLDPTKGEELSANPHWWGGKVPIQHVSFTFFASETSEALAFRAGEIDFTFYVSSPRSFAALSGTKPLAAQSCSNGFFSMNISQPGWSDVHVRRAVAYALNRADIIAAAGGYASPIYTFTPPSLLDSIASQSQINTLLNSIPLYQYNLTKARQEMAQSAYPHGFSATIQSPSGGNTTTLNQVAAAELARIGIRLTIKQVDANALGTLEVGPDGQRPTGMSGGFCFQPDPNTFSDFLGSSNLQAGLYNEADYAPPAVDTLLAQGLAASSPAQRFAVYSKLFARLQADLPYVGLYVIDDNVSVSSKFRYAGFNPWLRDNPYLLNIKSAA
jgi:peptide/nickel transport system substrate-binding protein